MRIVLLAAAALVCASRAQAESVERRLAADPRGEVEITNVAGEVRVLGWDRSEVQVNAELGRAVERLDFERNGALTVIEVVLPKRSSRSGASDLVVRVPRNSAVTISTINADQTVEEVRGMQRLHSVSGPITTQAWDAEIDIKTVSGTVLVAGHNGRGVARVSSVSGDVTLDKIGPELDLSTVTGTMRVDAKELTRARINTTNGNLRLTSQLARNARIDAEAVNGDLRLRLQGKLDAAFDVETFNGDIGACFGPEPQRSRRYGPGNEWRHQVGEGRARVRVKTLNGRVEICDE